MQSGNYLLILLGHNDKTTTAEIVRSRIMGMVTAARQAGVSPVLISPMVRNTGAPLEEQHIWGDLNIRNELIGISERENVPFVDLMKNSADWIASIGGKSPASAYFVTGDGTHSNEIGAKVFAEFAVDGIIAEVPELAVHLR